MMLKCDICGCEFDHTEAGDCDCGMGCGGQNVKCPNCGFDIPVPRELRPKNKSSMLNKIKSSLNI